MAYGSIVQHADELLAIFGRGRVFFDKEIRQLYNHDLSNPPFVIDFLIKREPDAVVIAEKQSEIVNLLKFAQANKIPVTPAAGRSSAYGGAVPAKGGILLDLSRLKKEIVVDVANKTVTTDPGVVILELDRELNRHGLMLATWPTSGPSATIGGWVAQGGVGIGAFRHGAIANQVLRCEIVLPNGDVKTFSGNELDVVNECSGITGIITKVTLSVLPKVDRVPSVAIFDSAAATNAALVEVSHKFSPWNLTWHNPTFSQLREEAGGPKTVPKKKWSVLAVFEAPEWEKVKADYTATVEKLGGKFLPEATAKAEWGEIYNTLRAKALGPSIAPGECIFPLNKMTSVLDEVDERFGYAPMSMEGTLIQGGMVTLLAFALEDERRPEYPLGFAAGINLVKIAKKNGGRAYAPGLYLAAEAASVFGSKRYQQIRGFKKAVDRSAIMNPGKIIGIRPRAKAILIGIPPLPAPEGAPMSTVDRVLNAPPMVYAMTKLAPLLAYHRPTEDRAAKPAIAKAMSAVQGSAFGKKHDWAVYSCSQCMFCRNVSPLSDAVGFEAGSPSGLIWWAREYLKGNLKPTKKVAEMVAAASETYVGDDVCPSKIPLSTVFKDWKVQLESDFGTKFQTPPALKTRIAASEAAIAEKKKRWETPVAPPAPVVEAKVVPKPVAKPAAAAAPAPAPKPAEVPKPAA